MDEMLDEKLEKALDFSNFRFVLSAQKKNLKAHFQNNLVLRYKDTIFRASPEMISFIATMINFGNWKQAVVLDVNENPINIDNLHEFLEQLVSTYEKAAKNYLIRYEKIKEARSIKKIMEW